MATIAEQLAAAVVDDSLKHASTPATLTKLPWVTGTGSWNEATGWSPPGFTSEADGAGTGASGGLYLNTETLKGGNAYSMMTWNTISGNLLKEREFSVWLFANVADATPDGYQLVAYQNASSESSGKTFVFKLKKWVNGVPSTLRENEATMEQGGAFALVKASGKVSMWIKKNSSSEWAILSTEGTDAAFTEGRSGFDGNGSNPKLTNFATGTLAVGTPPTATTEAADEIGKAAAELHGLVNPKGTETNCWFEYGTTTAYGYKTAVKSAGSGSSNVAAHELVEGLKPGTLYHFRVVAESVNGRTNGADMTFTTSGRKIRKRKKPSLALDVEIETPDGTFRLPADSLNAKFKPRNISFNTQRGEGFATATVVLSREIFKEYPDIGLLDTWRFISRSGEIAYEGRLQSDPRTNDPEEQITVNLIGWMSYLRGRKCSPLIIESRFNDWGEASTQRRINLISGNARSFGPTNGWGGAGAAAPGVNADFTSVTTVASRSDRMEAWFYAGGQSIGKLLYHFRNNVGSGNAGVWETRAYFSNNDVAGSYEGGVEHDGFTNSNPYETFSAKNSGWKYAFFISSRFDGSTGTALPDIQTWEYPKVIGTHGLEVKGSWPEVGFELTDIIDYILRTYYPKVELAGEENSFVVQQATWHSESQFGYDIIKQLNNLALWEMNIWEERKLHYERADLTKYDWQFKTTDKGVTVDFDGDSIENFANGCSVKYTDFNGITHTLYPDEHAELRDESPDNPYNKHGEEGWTDCDVPYQCSEAEALQFGRIYLEEFNRPKRPGSYKIAGGYLKDAAGNWRPGWAIRNGETCGVMDKVDDEPRLIVATNWDDETKVLTITVDAPDKLLDAIVARQQLAREARNI